MAACVLFNFDITIHEGGTYDKWFKWTIDDSTVSLDGTEGKMQIRKRVMDDEVLLDIPFSADAWSADGATGIYIDTDTDTWRIYITDDDSCGTCSDHRDIEGVYNLFLYNSDGESILKQYGVANIIAATARYDDDII